MGEKEEDATKNTLAQYYKCWNNVLWFELNPGFTAPYNPNIARPVSLGCPFSANLSWRQSFFDKRKRKPSFFPTWTNRSFTLSKKAINQKCLKWKPYPSLLRVPLCVSLHLYIDKMRDNQPPDERCFYHCHFFHLLFIYFDFLVK